MKYPIRSLAMTVTLLAAVGCDAAEYYPHHETPQQQSDLRKSGSGTYGGNNSNYPVGTPGTTGTDVPVAPAGTAPQSPAPAAN